MTFLRFDGRWEFVALLSILLTIVACKEEAPTTSSEPWDPFGHLDLVVGDSSAIDAPVEDGVSDDEETDVMQFDLPRLEVAQEVCFDDLYRPNTPSLFIENESLFLFYNATPEQEEATNKLYLRTSPLASFEFGEAQLVVNQGYQVDLVGQEGVL